MKKTKHIKLFEDFDDDDDEYYDEDGNFIYFKDYSKEEDKKVLNRILGSVYSYLFQEEYRGIEWYCIEIANVYWSLQPYLEFSDLQYSTTVSGKDKPESIVKDLYEYAILKITDDYHNIEIDNQKFIDWVSDWFNLEESDIEVDGCFYLKKNIGDVEYKIYNADDLMVFSKPLFIYWVFNSTIIDWNDEDYISDIESGILELVKYLKDDSILFEIVKISKETYPLAFNIFKSLGYDDNWLSRVTSSEEHKDIMNL